MEFHAGVFFDSKVNSFQLVTEQISLHRDEYIQLHRISKNGVVKLGNRFNELMGRTRQSDWRLGDKFAAASNRMKSLI